MPLPICRSQYFSTVVFTHLLDTLANKMYILQILFHSRFSVDSRDNPFLPGGDLEKEAEEILSRATIIRDKFILKDTDKVKSEHNPSSSHAKFESNAVPEVGSNALPVEETVTAEVNKMAESVPNARPKVNGQVTESEDSLTPGSVKMELTEENKDKKKQKKCCTIM